MQTLRIGRGMTRIIILPQRLALSAQPGALLKRLHGIERLRKRESERDEPYLALIRQLPCIRCGLEDCSEAAHVRMQSGTFNKKGGIGKKPADRWAIPLCGGPQGCHAEQHKIGEAIFWLGVGISPLLVCERLYAKRGDIVAMRAVVLSAIAERNR
jgi:hypothetical protein